MNLLSQSIQEDDSDYVKKLLRILNIFCLLLVSFFLVNAFKEVYFNFPFTKYTIGYNFALAAIMFWLVFSRLKLNKKFITVLIFLIIISANIEIFQNPLFNFLFWYVLVAGSSFFYFDYPSDKKYLFFLIAFISISFLISSIINRPFAETVVVNKSHQIIHFILFVYLMLGIVYCTFLKIRLRYSSQDTLSHKKTKIIENDKSIETVNVLDVINLAKQDDNGFLALFAEAYPLFWSNLIEIHPTLTITDKKFCAMLYLKFSTNDIAEYTNLNTRSVQTKKYNLRKKMNITGEKDIYKYIEFIAVNEPVKSKK